MLYYEAGFAGWPCRLAYERARDAQTASFQLQLPPSQTGSFEQKTTLVVLRNGNYSGGFLIVNCAGKKCTAPCSQGVSIMEMSHNNSYTMRTSPVQGVSIMEMTHNNNYTMRTNPVLTPCKQGAVHFSPRPHVFKQGVTR